MATPWGWGCVKVGIRVEPDRRCQCGTKATKSDPTMMETEDGRIVCVGCARREWEES